MEPCHAIMATSTLIWRVIHTSWLQQDLAHWKNKYIPVLDQLHQSEHCIRHVLHHKETFKSIYKTQKQIDPSRIAAPALPPALQWLWSLKHVLESIGPFVLSWDRRRPVGLRRFASEIRRPAYRKIFTVTPPRCSVNPHSYVGLSCAESQFVFKCLVVFYALICNVMKTCLLWK